MSFRSAGPERRPFLPRLLGGVALALTVLAWSAAAWGSAPPLAERALDDPGSVEAVLTIGAPLERRSKRPWRRARRTSRPPAAASCSRHRARRRPPFTVRVIARIARTPPPPRRGPPVIC
jgi:hypothetical protein